MLERDKKELLEWLGNVDVIGDEKMKYYKKIVGKRIYLSPVSTDEVDRYLKWMNDEAVAIDFGQYPRLVSSKMI